MQHVDVKIHEEIATILMDRPATRNALNPRLVDELSTALSDIHQEKRVRAVVLSGNGDDFCSGLDFTMMAEITKMPETDALAEWLSAWRQLTQLLESMLRFPKPIVAAVDGSALGAGLALALACDIIVPSHKASFGAPAVLRGLVGGATAALLNFRVGGATAARLLLTGQPIDANEAYRVGMCVAPVAPDQVWVAGSAMAQQCTLGSTEAIQATKRILNEGIGESLLTQLSSGAADSATACTTESATEGIESFIERREPNWP